MSGILIIGNGFDLAHGLPTRYSDFLDFANTFMALSVLPSYASVDEYRRIWDDFEHKEFATVFSELKKEGKNIIDMPILDLMYRDLLDNFWFEYFYTVYQKKILKGVNWIDFEYELSNIIQNIDNIAMIFGNAEQFALLWHQIEMVTRKENGRMAIFDECIRQNRIIMSNINYMQISDFINVLYSELRRLTEAIEIYLSYFIEKIKVKPLKIIADLDVDKVISFNYTDTYNRLYNTESEICYIHGRVREFNESIGDFKDGSKSELVLGIDEYLNDDRRNSDNRFAIFKKIIQRIRNHNDTRYYQWYEKIDRTYSLTLKNVGGTPIEVYTYGHSLAETDKDILKLFLQPMWSDINIYAYNETAEGELIQNLLNVITEDVVIEKSSRYPSLLNFWN